MAKDGSRSQRRIHDRVREKKESKGKDKKMEENEEGTKRKDQGRRQNKIGDRLKGSRSSDSRWWNDDFLHFMFSQ